jgi:hypothetical protein
MEAWLEVLKIRHVCKPLLHLFEAGEVFVKREDKAGGRDGRSVRG